MVIPELRRTAKSPSSWGNSSQSTARETLIPVRMDSEKAAPMERPSMKLCTPSPKMIIHATVATWLSAGSLRVGSVAFVAAIVLTSSTVGLVLAEGRSWCPKEALIAC